MIITRQVPFAEIAIDHDTVYHCMGSDHYVPDRQIRDRVEQLIDQAASIACPRYTCRIVEAGPTSRVSVTVGGVDFIVGKIIAPFFADSEQIAVFVATTGIEFEKWLHDVGRTGDILDQFIADSIGSVFAESIVERMVIDLEQQQNALGNRMSNRYSPGYCGWGVSNQRELFSLLPEESRCGVTLGDSCLMTPIKSVSGLISIGPKVQKHPYGCQICDKESCFRKKTNPEPQLNA